MHERGFFANFALHFGEKPGARFARCCRHTISTTGQVKLTYNILRALAVVIVVLATVIPAMVYVGLSIPWVQDAIRQRTETELSKLLDARVTIGKVYLQPINRATLRHVVVETAPGDTALVVDRLGAGIDVWGLLRNDYITVNYAVLAGADARLYRETPDGPLNIQRIINALTPKDKTKPPTKFDFKINSVIIRKSRFSYDVRSAEVTERFNPNHVRISDLRADIRLPRMTNDDFTVEIKRLGLEAEPGFTLENLAGNFHIAASELAVNDLEITLPNSHIALEDMALPLDGLNTIPKALTVGALKVRLKEGSSLYLPDLAPFLPLLSKIPLHATFNTFEASGNTTDATLLADIDLGGAMRLSAEITGRSLGDDTREIRLKNLLLAADGNRMADLLEQHSDIVDRRAAVWSRRIGSLSLEGDATLSHNRLLADISAVTTPGTVSIAADILRRGSTYTGDASVSTDGPFNVAALTDSPVVGQADCEVELSFSGSAKNLSGTVDADIRRIDFREHTFTDLLASIEFSPGSYAGKASIDNPDVMFDLSGEYTNHNGNKVLALEGPLRCPSLTVFDSRLPALGFDTNTSVNLAGPDFNNLEGHACLEQTRLFLPRGKEVDIDRLRLDAGHNENGELHLALQSDYIDGSMVGRFDFAAIANELKLTLAQSLPALLPYTPNDRPGHNDFLFDFTVKPTEELASTFRLPVSLVYPATVQGAFDGENRTGAATIDIPFLRQGNKLIEKTHLTASITEGESRAAMNFTTTAPTKNGPLTLALGCTGADNNVLSDITWKIERARRYEGDIHLSTDLARQPGSRTPDMHIGLLPGTATFNDTVWTISPAFIDVTGKEVTVNGINVHHDAQFIKINGGVSPDPDRRLTLDLKDFSLDYLFESLGIDKVMLGGLATGTFYASQLYSPTPALETDGLHVKNISYNKTVMGDALVKSAWQPENKAITLNADIDREGHRARVDGAIFPLNDSLDITFHADHTPIGFMAPYMEAFASDISGFASGRARIWGNFKYIDLEGDVYADSLRMKINFTNTYYTARDSVHFRPGLIDLSHITVRDAEGHSADLNGWVRHKFFKEPSFNFSLTNARNFLCYNQTPKESPIWYGKVYGNGSAFVTGKPGVVNINIDISTAPKSTFTFVLSDQEEAESYSFLTFRDKNHASAELTDTIEFEHDTSMDLVNSLRALAASHGPQTDEPSDYNITIQTRVTPDAQIVLVMDPIGGDRIRAYGSGSLRLDYGSANNDLKMYGTYRLDHGRYNFTLQDIILKDFTIKPGSEITFNGDPYAAVLNIKAAYSLNANLSDLDKSFLNDKDLNRTNVPVNAIMNVTGDMRQPEVAFDLEFPTLNSDVYRKVRSIVSTEDMMNQQIIYLLALNRFYTPEYMQATRGNELMSVASSTISSQLSNMLGSISDNWTVAPSLRSDRGDFSDVEVDVALSSRLLNNRLLINGNFGYRDKSLNANQFIGDFDLEYLLNRSGTLRLKAYNRFNDQNYYLRQALTTQGVGVAVSKDFDSLTSFMKPVINWFRKKKKKEPAKEGEKAATESVPEGSGESQSTGNPPLVPNSPALLEFRNKEQK